MTKSDDEARLIKRAQQGDADAFAEIYELHQPAVYRYVYYRVGNVATAEDLAAVVFTRVVEGIDKYRYRGRPLLAWLYTIARNAVIDHQRRSARDVTVPLDNHVADESVDAERAAERALSQQQLTAAMTHLTEDQRQVIMLRFIEEMTSEQVAEVLGKSTGAIKALQHRALAALRRHLEPEAD